LSVFSASVRTIVDRELKIERATRAFDGMVALDLGGLAIDKV
jgi:hypothetical protein